jgi:putative membrane protein
MNFLLKLLITSLAVFFGAYFFDGVYLAGFPTAIMVALLIGFLNAFLKPVLVVLTIPITLITFGLFLLVINASIILIADWALKGFSVSSFSTAVLFSLMVTLISWILEGLARPKRQDSVN